MTIIQASTHPEPNPTDTFRRALNALLTFGRDLLDRIQEAAIPGAVHHLPARIARNPQRAEQRVTRTLGWIIALARTLAGDSFYLLPPPGRATPQPQASRRAQPTRRSTPSTQQQRDTAHLRYIRKVFATQPTNRIAKRLARRLGAQPGTDLWPAELLAITEPPATWAARAYSQPTHPPQPTAEVRGPQQSAHATPGPVAFHRRQ